MKTKEEIKDILRRGKKEAFFNDMLPKETVSINIGNISTAAWSWMPPHKIVVGYESNENKSESYIKALLFHELSHSLWTERDIKEINKRLFEKSVPFNLYNLFEDARIEELYRKKTGKKFNWNKDMEFFPSLEASYLFNSLINNEGTYPDIVQNAIDNGLSLYLKYFSTRNHRYFYDVNGVEIVGDVINKLMNIAGWKSDIFINRKRAFNKAVEGRGQASKAACENRYIRASTPLFEKPYILVDVEKSRNVVLFDSDRNEKDTIKLLLQDGTAEKIKRFYRRACSAKNSYEIIDLCAEWLKEFPSEKNMETMGAGYSYDIHGMDSADIIDSDRMNYIGGIEVIDDNPLSDDGSSNQKSKTVGVAGSSSDSADSDNKKKKKEKQPFGKGDKIAFSNNLKLKDFTDERYKAKFDESELSRLTNLFKGVLKRGTVNYNSTIPSKRINIRNYSLGSDKIFKKSMYDTGKNENIAVILDCSGSMHGKYIDEGKKLLIIINRLAKQGLIKGNIILTHSNGQAVMDMPIYNEGVLTKIGTYNSEGYATCVKNTAHVLKKAKRVFVFTDGELGDVPDKNYNRSLGIKLWGLYAGEKDRSEQLKKFFDEAISKTSLEDVINELLKKVK